MDEYEQVGPDKFDYERDVTLVAKKLGQDYLGYSFGVEADGSDKLTDFVNAVAHYIYGAALAAEAAGVR